MIRLKLPFEGRDTGVHDAATGALMGGALPHSFGALAILMNSAYARGRIDERAEQALQAEAVVDAAKVTEEPRGLRDPRWPPRWTGRNHR